MEMPDDETNKASVS